jgi:hypothetical protein
MAHHKAQIELLVGRIITAIVMIHQGFSDSAYLRTDRCTTGR